MVHTVLIGLHAAAGVVAFVAGAVALRRGRLFAVYLWSLVAMVGFLALAVAAEWGQTGPALRALFAAFILLGGVMVWRAWLAGRRRPTAAAGPSARYIDHVGFTLVALLDAFVVITVLNTGAPLWSVVAAGVVVAVIGHFVLRGLRDRLLAGSAAGNRTDVAAAGASAPVVRSGRGGRSGGGGAQPRHRGL